MHMFSHTNVQKGALTSKSPTNTDIKINWWAPCGRVLRYAAPCFVFLFRWEIAQDRLMHASGMAREDNFLFPTSCYRSASRIARYSRKFNPNVNVNDVVMKACVFGLSGYLFQNNVFHSSGFFLGDGCNGGLHSSYKDRTALKTAAKNFFLPWRQQFSLSSSHSLVPMLPKEPLFSFCAKVANGIGFDKTAVTKRIASWRVEQKKKKRNFI